MVLVDTSIWIDYLRGTGAPMLRRAMHALLDEHTLAISPVIRLELLRGASLREADVLASVLGGIHELPFSRPHWDRANRLVIELRANGLTPSLADVMIATSALAHRIPLYHQDAVFDAMAHRIGLKIYQP